MSDMTAAMMLSATSTAPPSTSPHTQLQSSLDSSSSSTSDPLHSSTPPTSTSSSSSTTPLSSPRPHSTTETPDSTAWSSPDPQGEATVQKSAPELDFVQASAPTPSPRSTAVVLKKQSVRFSFAVGSDATVATGESDNNNKSNQASRKAKGKAIASLLSIVPTSSTATRTTSITVMANGERLTMPTSSTMAARRGMPSGSAAAYQRGSDAPANTPNRAMSAASGAGAAAGEQWWENVLPPGQLTERLRRAQGMATTVRGAGGSNSRTTSTIASTSGSTLLPSGQVASSGPEGPKSSRSRIIRSSSGQPATTTVSSGSERPRSISTLAPLGNTSHDHSLAAPTAPSDGASHRIRAGTWSSRSSITSFPSSSTRSSIGDISSASSSNDEGAYERKSSPILDEWGNAVYAERSSGTTSPTSFSRSQSTRRMRALGSDDGVGLGVTMRGSKSSVIDLDEHFRQWNNDMPFQTSARQSHVQGGDSRGKGQMQSSSSSSSSNGMRPFPSAQRDTVSAFPRHHDGPEASSEDEHSLLFAAKMAQRNVRTSSTRTTDTVRGGADPKRQTFPRASAPPTRRSSLHHNSDSLASRRVSFQNDVEVVHGDQASNAGTIGRAHGRSISTLNNDGNKRRSSHIGTDSTRLRVPQPSRHHDAQVREHAHSHVRGKRIHSVSAPTSPKIAMQSLPFGSLNRPKTSSASGTSTPRSHTRSVSSRSGSDAEDHVNSMANMAVLSSIGAAQSQMSSARSLAMALTRQLSAPLRPIFHITLFVSISSMAFMALAGFLVAGYLCTVWDDVNSRGKSLQRNVSSARRRIGGRVHWARSMLGMEDGSETCGPAFASGPEVSTASSSASQQHARRGSISSSSTTSRTRSSSGSSTQSTVKMITAPVRFAFSMPVAFVNSLTPKSVRESFATGNSPSSNPAPSSASSSDPSTQSTKPTRSSSMHSTSSARFSTSNARRSSTGSNGFHQMPPRPPLSSLLPSIAFTIVIAFGAGLASFFASRAAADGSSASTTSSAAAAAAATATTGAHHHQQHHSHHSRMPSAAASAPASPSLRARHESMLGGNTPSPLASQHQGRRRSALGLKDGSLYTPPSEGRRSPFNWHEVSAM